MKNCFRVYMLTFLSREGYSFRRRTAGSVQGQVLLTLGEPDDGANVQLQGVNVRMRQRGMRYFLTVNWVLHFF